MTPYTNHLSASHRADKAFTRRLWLTRFIAIGVTLVMAGVLAL